MKHEGSELLPVIHQWMEERILFRLVSLSGHCALETMLGIVLQLPYAYSNGCTLRAASNALSVHVDLVHLLSVRPHARLDVMIHQRFG